MQSITAYLLLLVLLVRPSTSEAQKNEEGIQLPDISKEIIKMREEDQKVRKKWADMVRKDKKGTDKFDEYTQKAIAIDRANTHRMREIIAEHGWPTYDLVGTYASNSAWLILQHADRNPLFQKKCLELLKEAVDQGQANPSNYAYLYDRVQVATGNKQLYATQSTTNNGLSKGSFQPIEDESNVQKRREEMGISLSVEEYAASMGFEYKIPTPEEAQARAQALKQTYESALQQAQEAMAVKNYPSAAESYLVLTACNGHVTTEDFLNAAKALSLARHDEVEKGIVCIMRALSRGWNEFDRYRNDSALNFMKEKAAFRWNDLLITGEEMSLDR